jgi:hypothetical protein
MSDTAVALGSLGSDLAFAVSFAIAGEALGAAQEAQISEDELIGIVLVISVVCSALPRSAMIVLRELEKLGCFGSLGGAAPAPSVQTPAPAPASAALLRAIGRNPKLSSDPLAGKGADKGARSDGKGEYPAEASGLAAFLTLLVSMAQRILISVAVQLLAANVRAKQPLRSVRIVSLLGVSVFFTFVQAGSSIGGKPNRS